MLLSHSRNFLKAFKKLINLSNISNHFLLSKSPPLYLMVRLSYFHLYLCYFVCFYFFFLSPLSTRHTCIHSTYAYIFVTLVGNRLFVPIQTKRTNDESMNEIMKHSNLHHPTWVAKFNVWACYRINQPPAVGHTNKHYWRSSILDAAFPALYIAIAQKHYTHIRTHFNTIECTQSTLHFVSISGNNFKSSANICLLYYFAHCIIVVVAVGVILLHLFAWFKCVCVWLCTWDWSSTNNCNLRVVLCVLSTPRSGLSLCVTWLSVSVSISHLHLFYTFHIIK